MTSAPGTRRRPAELRECMLRAGGELFSEQGFDATTSREIALRAGVSRSVFARHFGTKSNLLIEAVVSPFADFLGEFAREWRSELRSGDRDAAIHEFIDELQQLLTEHRSIVRAMLSTLASAEGDVIMRQVGERLTEVLQGLTLTAEQYAIRDDLNPDGSGVVARSVIGMVLMMVTLDSWFLPSGDARAGRDRVAQAMANLVARGGYAASQGG